MKSRIDANIWITETEVAFSGEVTISGLMKMMGEKVLGGVTDMLT